MGFFNDDNYNLTTKSKCPHCKRKGLMEKTEYYGEYVWQCGFCGKFFFDDGTPYKPKAYLYICPQCGILETFADTQSPKCFNCGCEHMVKTSYTNEEYANIAIDNKPKFKELRQHLRELFVINSEYFNPEMYQAILEKEFKSDMTSNNSTLSPSAPQIHCPTCGSTNVKRISAASKVAGAYAFGLFSKTAKSQFKCGNCGYKW